MRVDWQTWIVACGVLIILGCDESRAVASALSPEAQAKVAAVFEGYERIRAELAADQTASIDSNARAVEQAGRDAGRLVPEKLRPVMTQIANAAKRLKETPKNNIEPVRRAFGELSRGIVQLITLERSLATGRYLFECGMTTGYGKWIQNTSDISNPYMGSRMPGCGTTRDWE